MSLPKYVSSFAIGFIVGAGLALLYTPIPGKKFQRKVANLNEKVFDKVDDFKDAVRRAAS